MPHGELSSMDDEFLGRKIVCSAVSSFVREMTRVMEDHANHDLQAVLAYRTAKLKGGHPGRIGIPSTYSVYPMTYVGP